MSRKRRIQRKPMMNQMEQVLQFREAPQKSAFNEIEQVQEARVMQHRARRKKKMRKRVQLADKFNVGQQWIVDQGALNRRLNIAPQGKRGAPVREKEEFARLASSSLMSVDGRISDLHDRRAAMMDVDGAEGTQLISLRVASVAVANQVFFTEVGEDVIPIVLLPAKQCWRFWCTVPTGVFAIATRYGRILGVERNEDGEMMKSERALPPVAAEAAPRPARPARPADVELVERPVAPEGEGEGEGEGHELGDEAERIAYFDVTPAGCLEPGFHWLCCGKRVSYVVTKNHVPFDFPVKMCHTLDHVFVSIDTLIVFHITDPVFFVVTLGPYKLTTLLRAKLEEAIRSLARRSYYTEVYDLRGRSLTNMMRSLNDTLEQFGVEVTQVNVTNIELAEDLQASMQAITLHESELNLQTIKQEFELLCKQHSNEKLSQDQKRRHQQTLAEMHQRRRVMLVSKERVEVECASTKSVGRINAEGKHEVKQIKLKAELEQAKLVTEKKMMLRRLKEEGEKVSGVMKAKEEAYDAEKKSEVDVTLARNRADCLSHVASAEAKASQLLLAKRLHEQEAAKIDVLDGLASNKNCYIAGSSNYSPLAQIADVAADDLLKADLLHQ